MLSSINDPAIVASVGAALVVCLPFVNVWALCKALSLGTLQIVNLFAFAINLAAVSVPGRLDGEQDARMRAGDLNPDAQTPLHQPAGTSTCQHTIVMTSRSRTLLAPAGWAFAIWGPIYLGEALFCLSQYYNSTIQDVLPTLTAPFVAANLMQSLWCASFRPNYIHGWHKYISVFMLGGTAFALSLIPFANIGSWYLVPLAMHFGWTTAATLVNFNGSLAMNTDASEGALISAGHASSVLALALGVCVTLSCSLPAYGFTVAWAMAACADGVRVKPRDPSASDSLRTGAKVQVTLLAVGSLLSIGASVFAMFQ